MILGLVDTYVDVSRSYFLSPEYECLRGAMYRETDRQSRIFLVLGFFLGHWLRFTFTLWKDQQYPNLGELVEDTFSSRANLLAIDLSSSAADS